MTKRRQHNALLFCYVAFFFFNFFYFKCYKSEQVMCELNAKVQSSNSLRLTNVSAKSKIHSPRRCYLSPGHSIVLEKKECSIIHNRHKLLLILGLISQNSSTLPTVLFSTC